MWGLPSPSWKSSSHALSAGSRFLTGLAARFGMKKLKCSAAQFFSNRPFGEDVIREVEVKSPTSGEARGGSHSVRENACRPFCVVSFAPAGLAHSRSFTHVLRRGLHSIAAPRLRAGLPFYF